MAKGGQEGGDRGEESEAQAAPCASWEFGGAKFDKPPNFPVSICCSHCFAS